MELDEVVARRRMVRSFAPDPVDPATVDRICEEALRAPSAGHARGTELVVLSGAAETARYWDHATTADWRASDPRFGALSRAQVAVLVVTSPDRYRRRYEEEDKRRRGPGVEAWPVPFWHVDAGMVTLLVLLGATQAGLASCFLGNFRAEHEVLGALGVPEGWRLVGAVLLGLPDGEDWRSRSLDRPGPSRRQRVHHGRWDAPAP